MLSLDCRTADTVATETPGFISEGTRDLANYNKRNQTSPDESPDVCVCVIILYTGDASDLGQQVNALVSPAEGKPQDGAAAVGHGRRLQLQHQVCAVRLSWRRLSVMLRTDHVKRLMKSY